MDTTQELDARLSAASRGVEDARRVVFHHPGKLGVLVEQISVLAELRAKQGDLRKAESLYREAMFRVRDLKHPDLSLESGILSLLAHLYDAEGLREKCIEHYEMALEVGLRAEPKDYVQLGTIQNNLGMTIKEEGRLDAAADLYRQALQSFRLVDGESSPRVATVLNNYGVLHYEQMRIHEALECHQKALQIRTASFGQEVDDAELAQSYKNLSAVYRALGEFKEAEDCLVEARRLARDAVPQVLKPRRAAALLVDRSA